MNTQVRDLLEQTRKYKTNTVVFVSDFHELNAEQLQKLRDTLQAKGFDNLGHEEAINTEQPYTEHHVLTVYGPAFQIGVRANCEMKLIGLAMERIDVNFSTLIEALEAVPVDPEMDSVKRCEKSDQYEIIGRMPFGSVAYSICGACAQDFIEGNAEPHMVQRWCEPNSVRILLATVIGFMQSQNEKQHSIMVQGPETRQ